MTKIFDFEKEDVKKVEGETRVFSNRFEALKELDEILLKINSTIVCNALVATKIQESYHYENSKEKIALKDEITQQYEIGTYNKNIIMVDPYMRWHDLKIYNQNKEELIDLSKLGFDTQNLM